MKVLHTFSRQQRDGGTAQGTVIEGRGGALFGTTVAGGSYGQGTLFSLQRDGTKYQLLHSFPASAQDGRNPLSGLIQGVDGFLYGSTESGGVGGLGAIFKISSDGKNYTLLYSFSTFGGVTPDGRNPYAALTQSKQGLLFGTTLAGGNFGAGVLYQLTTNGTGYRILYHFGQGIQDGKNPRGQLLQASDGQLYGSASGGSSYLGGVLFAIKEDGRDYRVIHSFANGPGDGSLPYAGLIEGGDGKLYGTTVAGGRGAQGVIFSLNKDGSAYEVLRHFTGLQGEGRNLYAGVIEGKDSALYGTTLGGGAHNCGLIFRLAKTGKDYQALYSFTPTGAEGRGPYAGLSQSTDGDFYGTTTGGTTENLGVVFRLRVSTKP